MCDIFVNARMRYSDDVEAGDVDRRSEQPQPLAVLSNRGGQFCGSGGQMSFPRDAPACREYGAAIDARDAGDERKAC